jgi:hypothetical protein
VATCPTCGQPIKRAVNDDADHLLAVLMHGNPHREVYRGRDGGGWFVTYGGGPYSERAVQELVERHQIQSVYSSIPDEAYHVGRTWDCERTMAARKKIGKAAPNYFVGDR